MSRTMAAAMRRANRLMRPAGLRTLGIVLKHLSAAQSAMSGGKSTSKRRAIAVPVPKGARYLARKHRSAAGSRDYKIYLPASQPLRPKGLILMLHGCNQTPDDFARGTNMNAQAEKHQLAIVYPGQTANDNPASCWNWFKPGDQGRGAGEPAMLAALVRKLMKELGLGRESVFVAGLSAGGAMAAILADVYPDVFSGAGVHSGLARGAARDVMSAMSAMRSGGTSQVVAPSITTPRQSVRRIIFHGDADDTVHVSNSAMIVTAALGNNAAPTKVGHRSVRGGGYSRSDFTGADGEVHLQLWMLKGAGHAWSGGHATGSYTDTKGPDASALMVRFFLAQSR